VKGVSVEPQGDEVGGVLIGAGVKEGRRCRTPRQWGWGESLSAPESRNGEGVESQGDEVGSPYRCRSQGRE